MKAQTAILAQHSATSPRPRPCPECGHAGPHQNLGDGWAECSNYYRTRIDEHRWTVCGATWQYAVTTSPGDPLTERVIDLLDDTDIGITDTRIGGSVLTWDSTLAIAQRVATDRTLAALIREQSTGTAA